MKLERSCPLYMLGARCPLYIPKPHNHNNNNNNNSNNMLHQRNLAGKQGVGTGRGARYLGGVKYTEVTSRCSGHARLFHHRSLHPGETARWVSHHDQAGIGWNLEAPTCMIRPNLSRISIEGIHYPTDSNPGGSLEACTCTFDRDGLTNYLPDK